MPMSWEEHGGREPGELELNMSRFARIECGTQTDPDSKLLYRGHVPEPLEEDLSCRHRYLGAASSAVNQPGRAHVSSAVPS